MSDEPNVETAIEDPPVEKPEEKPKVDTPPGQVDSTEVYFEGQNYSLTESQKHSVLQKGMAQIKAEEEAEKTKDIKVVDEDKPEKTMQEQLDELKENIKVRDRNDVFTRQNEKNEQDLKNLIDSKELSPERTKVERELTFSVMARNPGVTTSQAYKVVEENMKAMIDQIANSKEVQARVIADYTSGKLKDVELTIGEASSGQTSGVTDDKPLDMGGLRMGTARDRLRDRLTAAKG